MALEIAGTAGRPTVGHELETQHDAFLLVVMLYDIYYIHTLLPYTHM